MQVQVHAVGFLKRYTSRQVPSVWVEVSPGMTVRQLLESLDIPEGEVLRVAVNDQIVALDHEIAPHSTVRVIPPIGGGMGAAAGATPRSLAHLPTSPRQAYNPSIEVRFMPCGITGQILRIDLSSRETTLERPDESFYRHYWGGRGFIAYYLLREMAIGTDPLGPDNLLIFATGALTGVPFGGSGRHSIGARSPLTGAFGESEAGGYWGAELKGAGFDSLVIRSCADRPVYLWIYDGQVDILDVTHLWGLPTADAQAHLRKEVGDPAARVALIGPGGEAQVLFATISHDLNHVASRTGMDAVMGSKKLKAIIVCGHEHVALADPEQLKSIARWLARAVDEDPGLAGLQLHGTARLVGALNALGALPTHNFREGVFAGAQSLSGETLTETMLKDRGTCFSCPVRCKRVIEPPATHPFDGRYGGPEYETIAALGSNCGVDDLAVVVRANAMCSAYGLDTISTGMSISFAMECSERGLLTKEQIGGLDLRFGSAEAVLELVELIAHKQGIGELLAQGMQMAAESIGGAATECAMHVMGLEVPLQEPRLAFHRGLGYVVGPTGADRLVGAPETFFDKEGPRLANYRSLGAFEPSPLVGFSEDKLRLYAYSHLWYSFFNCVGERTATMARAFNAREGFGPVVGRLPSRFHQRQPTGPLRDIAIDENDVERGKATFYGMMGWDPNTGVPTRDKLQELGIGWVKERGVTDGS